MAAAKVSAELKVKKERVSLESLPPLVVPEGGAAVVFDNTGYKAAFGRELPIEGEQPWFRVGGDVCSFSPWLPWEYVLDSMRIRAVEMGVSVVEFYHDREPTIEGV